MAGVPQHVPLPLNTGVIPLPHQPGIPPSAADVIAARQYRINADIGFRNDSIDSEGLASAMEYEHNILQARGGIDAAPAWFALAMQQSLQPINNRLNDLSNQVDALNNQLGTLEGHTLEIHRLATVNHNMQCGDGSRNSYLVVLFRDGTDPTMPPHSLPILQNQGHVNSLRANHTSAYHAGYYGEGAPATTAERKKKILIAIRGFKNF